MTTHTIDLNNGYTLTQHWRGPVGVAHDRSVLTAPSGEAWTFRGKAPEARRNAIQRMRLERGQVAGLNLSPLSGVNDPKF